jgi:hypothetical protein
MSQQRGTYPEQPGNTVRPYKSQLENCKEWQDCIRTSSFIDEISEDEPVYVSLLISMFHP